MDDGTEAAPTAHGLPLVVPLVAVLAGPAVTAVGIGRRMPDTADPVEVASAPGGAEACRPGARAGPAGHRGIPAAEVTRA